MAKGYGPSEVDPYFTEYLKTTGDKALTKWQHYLPVYTRELSRFRQEPIRFLEIGVFQGGSLPLWKDFFCKESTMVFIDIDPDCEKHEIEDTNVRIGNQADPRFLEEVVQEFGPFDLILDDGSHISEHQIFSYEFLWPHINNEGLYIVEDTHTSYWPGFGGGYQNAASFMEYSKSLVDAMHSWYTDEDDVFPFNERAKELCSIRYYDSIVVIEKLIQNAIPQSFFAKNGKIEPSQSWFKKRGRTSYFAGRDGWMRKDKSTD